MIVPMAPTARAARVFGATNARAHDAAPLPLWNAHLTGANLSVAAQRQLYVDFTVRFAQGAGVAAQFGERVKSTLSGP